MHGSPRPNNIKTEAAAMNNTLRVGGSGRHMHWCYTSGLGSRAGD